VELSACVRACVCVTYTCQYGMAYALHLFTVGVTSRGLPAMMNNLSLRPKQVQQLVVVYMHVIKSL